MIMKNIRNMVRSFWWRNQVAIICVAAIVVLMLILNVASEYDRASCVERGGTWNHGVVAGRYSAWCQER